MPKQKKLPVNRSTRPPCPIGLDCLMVAEQGKPCPNKSYCSMVASPWSLPYKIEVWADGTQYMSVDITYSTQSERIEKEAAGFAEADSLPYLLIKSDLGKPILLVNWCRDWHEEHGWFEPCELDFNYPLWVAARIGASYREFREVASKDSDWWKHWGHSLAREPYEPEIPSHPHCILPIA